MLLRKSKSNWLIEKYNIMYCLILYKSPSYSQLYCFLFAYFLQWPIDPFSWLCKYWYLCTKRCFNNTLIIITFSVNCMMLSLLISYNDSTIYFLVYYYSLLCLLEVTVWCRAEVIFTMSWRYISIKLL